MSQKTDTMIKLALVFTVSLLSFSIGTYVGKMYSDNQHKLAQLEPQTRPAIDHQEFAAGHAPDAEKAADGSAVQEAALTDSEVAKIAEEFAADDSESTEEGKAIAVTNEHSEKEIKTVTANVAKSAVANTRNVAAINEKAPAAAKPSAKSLTASAIEQLKKMEEERQPAAVPAKEKLVLGSSMYFTVQVGSFPTEAEAQKMTKELVGKGFKTSMVPAQVNGQTWFRVNVGLFPSVKEAQDYKKDFLEKTKLTSAFVQKVQK